MQRTFGDVSVRLDEAHVAIVELHRPPNNFFDTALITSLADAYEALEAGDCRAIVLCAEGKHFCAGADFVSAPDAGASSDVAAPGLYDEAARMLAAAIPVVAAVQGAAIGGGFGLACSADFRVATPESRFAANFARLGFHHGFGLTVTLPPIVGNQHALDLLYTGRRIDGGEASSMGLCDRLASSGDLRDAAVEFAREIAGSAPLAVRSIRQTMRADVVDRFRVATQHESLEQDRLRLTADWHEGVRASAERRDPEFTGR